LSGSYDLTLEFSRIRRCRAAARDMQKRAGTLPQRPGPARSSGKPSWPNEPESGLRRRWNVVGRRRRFALDRWRATCRPLRSHHAAAIRSVANVSPA
jgi:hypothetical protein